MSCSTTIASSLFGQSFRIGAYTLGYTRDIGQFHKMQMVLEPT